MGIGTEKYIAFTTFRKDGTPVSSPTWIVDLDDGRVGFWTSSATGKVKRLRHTPKVTLQPSDARGRAKSGSTVVEGTAEMETSGPAFDELTAKVRAKYGFTVHLTRLANTLGHLFKAKAPYGDVAVLVTLPPVA